MGLIQLLRSLSAGYTSGVGGVSLSPQLRAAVITERERKGTSIVLNNSIFTINKATSSSPLRYCFQGDVNKIMIYND